MLPRTLTPLLLAAALACGGCGLAESIAGNFVDDEDVVLPVNATLSGTVIRDTGGTDLLVENGSFTGGDTLTDDFCVCVCAFSIDASQQPGNTKIKRAVLRIYIETDGGDPAPLAPLVASHLPNHPNQPLTPGVVPHPVGNDLAVLGDVTTPGWREIDVTHSLLADWNAGRPISAYALRLDVMTDGDGVQDAIALEAPGGGGRAELVLTFGLDL